MWQQNIFNKKRNTLKPAFFVKVAGDIIPLEERETALRPPVKFSVIIINMKKQLMQVLL